MRVAKGAPGCPGLSSLGQSPGPMGRPAACSALAGPPHQSHGHFLRKQSTGLCSSRPGCGAGALGAAGRIPAAPASLTEGSRGCGERRKPQGPQAWAEPRGLLGQGQSLPTFTWALLHTPGRPGRGPPHGSSGPGLTCLPHVPSARPTRGPMLRSLSDHLSLHGSLFLWPLLALSISLSLSLCLHLFLSFYVFLPLSVRTSVSRSLCIDPCICFSASLCSLLQSPPASADALEAGALKGTPRLWLPPFGAPQCGGRGQPELATWRVGQSLALGSPLQWAGPCRNEQAVRQNRVLTSPVPGGPQAAGTWHWGEHRGHPREAQEGSWR